jgi:hypothetical protein
MQTVTGNFGVWRYSWVIEGSVMVAGFKGGAARQPSGLTGSPEHTRHFVCISNLYFFSFFA